MTYNSLKRSHLRPISPFAVETTDVGSKAREEEWEQASNGTAGTQEEVVEGEEELMEVEGDGDGGV
jgi:hypothetical protein